MEQRPQRLGDIVDDYCPRERRVTNHVVVALVEDSIRQTRCTTCDADHVYKGGREPRRKLVKKETSALYDEVLANVTGTGTSTPVSVNLSGFPALNGQAKVFFRVRQN